MPFGQLVVGPPGSGKSTYCHGMQQLMSAIKRQPCYIVNLDPANDRLPYDCAVDVFELVRLRDVMEQEGLGVFLHSGGPRHVRVYSMMCTVH